MQSEKEDLDEKSPETILESSPELGLDKQKAESADSVSPLGAENSQIQQDLAQEMPRSDSLYHAKDEAFDAPKQPPRRMVFTRNS